MALQIGDLFYKVRADTRSLRAATRQIASFSRQLERASGFASKLEKSIQAVSATGARAGNALASSFKASKIKTIENARREFERLGEQIRKSSTGSVQSLGALTRSFTSFERAAKNATSVEQLVRAQERFNNVAARQQRVLRSTEQALKQKNEAEQRSAKDIANTRREINNLVTGLRQAGASDVDVRRLVKAFQEFRVAAKSGTLTASEFTQLQQRMSKATERSTRQLKELNKAAKTKQLEVFKNSMEAATKSVVLALGPLSGVGARITALSGLFRSNVIILAAVLTAFTALGVLLQRAASAGQEAEAAMLKVSGVLAAMGDSAAFAADELDTLNDIAVRVGRETLASVSGVRKAEAILLTFGKVGREVFEETLFAAQGLSTVMGGELAINTRRLGRLMQDPARNLDALTRAGIQFSKSEERVIKQLQATGKAFVAQRIILQRLEPLTKAGKSEALALAGAFDTLGENVNIFLEAVAGVGASLKGEESAIGSISKVVVQLGKNFENLSENQRVIDTLSTILSVSVNVFGSALLLVIKNVDLLGLALIGLGAGVIFKIVQPSLKALTFSLAGVRAVALAAFAAVTTLKGGLLALSGPIGLVLGVLAALGLRMLGTSDKAQALALSLDEVKRELEELSKASPEGREIALTAKLAKQQAVLQEHLQFVEDNARKLDRISVGGITGKTGRDEILASREALRGFREQILALVEGVTKVSEIDFGKLSDEQLERIVLILQKAAGAGSELSIELAGTIKELLKARRASDILGKALEDVEGGSGSSADSLVDLQDSLEDLVKRLAPGSQALQDFITDEGRLVAVLKNAEALLAAQEAQLRELAETQPLVDIDIAAQMEAGRSAIAALAKALVELRKRAEFDILEDDAKEAFDEFEKGSKDATRALRNMQDQQRALQAEGIIAVEELILLQEMDEAIIELSEDLKNLKPDALAELGRQLGITSIKIEDLARAQALLVFKAAKVEVALGKETDALQAFEDTIPDAIDELIDLQDQLRVLETQGSVGLENLIDIQQIRLAGEALAALADDFPKGEEIAALTTLRTLFPELISKTDSLKEAFRKFGEETERTSINLDKTGGAVEEFEDAIKDARLALRDLEDQERVLNSLGVVGVEELVMLQDMTAATREWKETLKDLTDEQIASLAVRFNVTATTAQQLAGALAAIILQGDRLTASLEREKDALTEFEEAMPDAVDELKDLQEQLEVFNEKGKKAFEKIVATQEIRKAGEEMAELAKRFPGDKEIEKLQQLREEFPLLVGDAQTLVEALRRIGEQTEQMQQRIQRATTKTNDFAKLLGASFESMFENAIIGGEGFREVISSLIKDLVKLTLRLLIIKPLIEGLTRIFGVSGPVGSTTTPTTTGTPSGLPTIIETAKGAVFNRGALTPFAHGGLITQPTVFPFKGGVGLAGEAGAEAILPLVRRRGKLGVETTGKGGINVTIHAPGADEGTVQRIKGIVEVELVPQIIKASTQNTINRLKMPSFS